MDQARCDPADRALCNHAAAMWRRDESNSSHFMLRVEEQCVFKQRFSLRRKGGLRGRCAEEVAPYLFTLRVGDHQPAKNATHAMTYQNHRAVIGKGFVQRIELAPKQQ